MVSGTCKGGGCGVPELTGEGPSNVAVSRVWRPRCPFVIVGWLEAGLEDTWAPEDTERERAEDGVDARCGFVAILILEAREARAEMW